MPQQTVNQIYYIVACINECAARWGISSAEAYRYLHEHGGMTWPLSAGITGGRVHNF